jgi:hypothetical protein
MMETDMKTRHKLIRLLGKVQDNGETWRVDEDGCNLCEIVRNAKVVDFLIENGVGFVTDNNDGSK